MTFGELCKLLTERLGSAHEARVLLEEATGERPSVLALRSRDEVGDDVVERAIALGEQRAGGIPLQHVVGHWPFRGIELVVDRRALIPRPETEQLVDHALGELGERDAKRRRVLDLGTGTAAIAVSLAFERDDLDVVAIDRSSDALSLAAINLAQYPELMHRVELREGDWFEALSPDELPFDLVVSNPPYLSEQEWTEVEPVVRDFDPYQALVAGPSGTEALERLLVDLPAHLADQGSFVAEIGWLQRSAVLELATKAGARSSEVRVDGLGRDRFLVARF